MSAKAAICIRTGSAEEYPVYHCPQNGGPRELGAKLLHGVAKRHRTARIIRETGAAPLDELVFCPRDVYPDVIDGVEWVYVIEKPGLQDRVTLEIYRTSYPYTKRRFTWLVWSCTGKPDKAASRQLETAEATANSMLRALHAFEKAV